MLSFSSRRLSRVPASGFSAWRPAAAASGAFSSAAQERALSAHSRKDRRTKHRQRGKDAVQLPLIKQTLKRLYLKIHPDFFHHYPEHQKENEQSFQHLMGFLDTIEKGEESEFPPAQKLQLPFYLRTATDGHFDSVALSLHTTGGDCRFQVQESFEDFLHRCGLPNKFRWAGGSWGGSVPHTAADNMEMPRMEVQQIDMTSTRRRRASPKTEVVKEEKNSKVNVSQASSPPHQETAVETPSAPPAQQPPLEEVPQATAAETAAPVETAASAGTPSLEDMEAKIQKFDALCEAIAALPYMDDDDDTRTYVLNTVLPTLHGLGFRIEPAVQRIWEGDLNTQELTKGLDADSAALVCRIVLHRVAIEKFVQTNDGDQQEPKESAL